MLSAEVGEAGVFGAEWRAERADRLHDEAVAMGWDPPVYRGTVEVLGVTRLTGALSVGAGPL